MVNKRIRIPRATAHEIMNELGKLEDTIEFIDLNKDNIETKRNFNEIISRCDDSEKRLARFEKFCSDHNVEIYKYDNYDSFISDLTEDVRARDRKYGSTYFDLIEAELIEDEKKFLELVESSDRIGEKYSELIEKKAVMEKMREMFVAGEIKDLVSYAPSQSYHEMGQASDLSYIAGVCRAEDELRLKRMIFRVGKGRALMTFFNLNQGNNTVNKIKHKNAPPLRKIFLIFLQSGVENYLLTKINKILEVFNVNRYQIPRPDKIPEELKQIQEELAIQISILKEGEGIISNFLLERIGNVKYPA